MKLNDVELIKSTFARIESEQHAFAGRFYANLFQSCPEVEQLFKSVGMEMQGKMVIQAIGIAVNSMDHPDDFSTIFRSLGRRHLLYGVKSDFYPFLSEAFIETCKSTFGSLIDDWIHSHWEKVAVHDFRNGP